MPKRAQHISTQIIATRTASARLMRKDVRLALDLAAELGVPMELSRIAGRGGEDSQLKDDDDFNRIADFEGFA